MVDVAFAVARIGVALFLVALNGFFVAAEFALVRLRPTTVQTMVREGRRSAGLIETATENLDDYLAVCQLGITISSLGLGWIGEPAVAVLVDPLLEPVLPSGLLHVVTVGVGFGIITFLHVVYGELAPKTLAIERAERVAQLVAWPMRGFYYLFMPGIVVFNGIANASTRLVGVSPAGETEETHSEEEILAILSRSGAAGHVDAGEVEMIRRVFDLDDTAVREIMRPRPDVVSVPSSTPLSELRAMAVETGYTRYPVIDDGGDEIVGYVDVKDLLRTLEHVDAEAAVTAGDLARAFVVVPETLRVDDLLEELQSEHRQMAAVIDEWGTFEGLVTVEDVVEELVGDVQDQFDREEPPPSIDPLDGGGYRVDGQVSVDHLDDVLGTDLESDEFETVGGFVLSRLGRAPAVDDAVSAAGHEFRVAAVDGARILEVTVHRSDGVE